MQRNKKLQRMVMAALLCAIGILIPLISPLKVVIEPASFTLASHVAIWIAVFISPLTAAVTCIGTTLGFVLAGLPPAVILRAGSQIIFATIGAFIFRAKPQYLESPLKAGIVALGLSAIHAVCEVLVVLPLYVGLGAPKSGLFYTLFILVGIGTLIHSMVDFFIAMLVWQPLKRVVVQPAPPA